MKNARIKAIAFLLMLCLLALLTICAGAETMAKKTSARAGALYEPSSGRFLYEKNANEQLPMASTTKIMTALIALEECDLSEDITVPKEATGIEGSSLYLKEGDRVNTLDLIYALLLGSANDAAALLALKISGDIQSFARLMNERARELGLTDTSFANPHGLDSEGHYTTARDLAILSSVALDNPSFYKICSTYKHTMAVGDRIRTIVNHNKLLNKYEGAIGVKTGYTKRCGRCLVGAAERNGIRLISVTLDAPDDWNDHITMLDYGFSILDTVDINDILPRLSPIPVIGGEKQELIPSINTPLHPIVRLRGENVTSELSLPKYLVSPIKSGQKIGELIIKRDNTIAARIDIVANEDISNEKPRGFLDRLFD